MCSGEVGDVVCMVRGRGRLVCVGEVGDVLCVMWR